MNTTLDALVSALSKSQSLFPGAHPSDETLTAYVQESLSKTEVKRLDEHLSGCVGCTEVVQGLLDVQEFFDEDLNQRLDVIYPPEPKPRFAAGLVAGLALAVGTVLYLSGAIRQPILKAATPHEDAGTGEMEIEADVVELAEDVTLQLLGTRIEVSVGEDTNASEVPPKELRHLARKTSPETGTLAGPGDTLGPIAGLWRGGDHGEEIWESSAEEPIAEDTSISEILQEEIRQPILARNMSPAADIIITEIDGVTTGDNVQVGGIQVSGPRVDETTLADGAGGEVTANVGGMWIDGGVRLNSRTGDIVVLATGDHVRALVGGIQIGDSRVTGDITVTEINGAALAAGDDIHLQVGGIRIEDLRVTGDIGSYTQVNGVVLGAGSNIHLQVGGVSIR